MAQLNGTEQNGLGGDMVMLINLMTRDQTRRTKARTIATTEVVGLRSAGFVGEGGQLLKVIAEKIDAATVVDKIRKAGLRDARLISVEQHKSESWALR